MYVCVYHSYNKAKYIYFRVTPTHTTSSCLLISDFRLGKLENNFILFSKPEFFIIIIMFCFIQEINTDERVMQKMSHTRIQDYRSY